jgi:hypothetical protein
MTDSLFASKLARLCSIDSWSCFVTYHIQQSRSCVICSLIISQSCSKNSLKHYLFHLHTFRVNYKTALQTIPFSVFWGVFLFVFGRMEVSLVLVINHSSPLIPGNFPERGPGGMKSGCSKSPHFS